MKHYKLVYHQRLWPPLISWTMLKHFSQNSNFRRVTILQNELFSPFNYNVFLFGVTKIHLIIFQSFPISQLRPFFVSLGRASQVLLKRLNRLIFAIIKLLDNYSAMDLLLFSTRDRESEQCTPFKMHEMQSFKSLGRTCPLPTIEYCTSGAGQFTPLALKCTPMQNLSPNLHLLISLGCITLCF